MVDNCSKGDKLVTSNGRDELDIQNKVKMEKQTTTSHDIERQHFKQNQNAYL